MGGGGGGFYLQALLRVVLDTPKRSAASTRLYPKCGTYKRDRSNLKVVASWQSLLKPSLSQI